MDELQCIAPADVVAAATERDEAAPCLRSITTRAPVPPMQQGKASTSSHVHRRAATRTGWLATFRSWYSSLPTAAEPRLLLADPNARVH
jgi:hypothetical protein